MKIRKGTLLPDSEPVGTGINSARRGLVVTRTDQIQVIFKKLSEPELAAEIFCADLARNLGLPAPEPILLYDPVAGEILYGCVDLEYPNSLRAFNITPPTYNPAARKILEQALLAWPKINEVAAFDEWIDNRDRNLGNLLFVGPKEFAIIDHGKALDIDPSYPSQNVLCKLLAADCASTKEVRALLRTLFRESAAFDIMNVEATRASLESTGIATHTDSAERFFDFVENRLADLNTHLRNRFPGQQGLLIGATT